MLSAINDILNGNYKVTEKQEMLSEFREKIIEELEEAEEIVTDGYEYCPYCNEYYRDNTFESEQISEKRNICTFHDPTEFGEDKYEDKTVTVLYHICPVGHKIEINYTV